MKYFLTNNINEMPYEGIRTLSLETFSIHGPAISTDISLFDGISFF